MSGVYGIDDGDGTALTSGLDEHTVWRTAQRMADERGEPVYVYEIGCDDDATEVEPR